MVLAKVELARQALAEAHTIEEVWDIRQMASAALHILKSQRDASFEAQNFAAEIKVRAERKLGEMLRAMEKRDGGDAMRARSQDVTELDVPPSYADLGLNKMAASRWQAIASIPEERFEEYVQAVKEAQEELTSAALAREAKRILAREKIKDVSIPQGKYKVIYADPPWKYQNTMPDYLCEQADHYPLLTADEIAALPITDLAADNSILFLWATAPILVEALQVLQSWGFEYKAKFVWDKVKHNLGHYNSVRHEVLLIGTRGSCQPENRHLFDSVVTEERRQHSQKPLVFYQMRYPQDRTAS